MREFSPPAMTQQEEWEKYLKGGSSSDYTMDRKIRIAVSSTHCLEWVKVRTLLDKAIDSITYANNREDRLQASELVRMTKLLADTLMTIQKGERATFRIDSSPIQLSKGELDKINRVIFTVVQKEKEDSSLAPESVQEMSRCAR